MSNKKKIAFFDFCETLVDFQTADAFVDFVRKRTKNPKVMSQYRRISLLQKIGLVGVLEKLTFHKLSINKQLVLSQLKGLDYSLLSILAKEYYEKKIKPHFIIEMVNKLVELKNEGWQIVLVSGGYDIYLRFFAEEFRVDEIVSSSIGFDGNVCTGKFGSMDCLNENKVILLNQLFNKEELYSIAFSDSITDLPLFKWVDEGYVVSHEKSQVWANKYNLKELIWIRKK